ncbi:MAG: AI-2E family transporter [Bacillota bacterium]
MTSKEKKLILLLIVALAIYFLYLVRGILLPFVLGLFLALVLEPVINFLVTRTMPRMGALVFVFGILLTLCAVIAFIFIPAVLGELNDLASKIPDYFSELESLVEQLNNRYQAVEMPQSLDVIFNKMIERLERTGMQFVERTSQVLIALLSRSFSLLLAPVLAFYILKDLEVIKNNLSAIIPRNYRQGVQKLLTKINQSLFEFMKGQLIISFSVGFLSIIGLYYLEIKFYLVIGILAGILNIIPYIGPIFAVVPAVLIASFTSFKLAASVIILFIIIQQLEGAVISPKIMGSKVGLHPLIIIFALLVGGELLGIFGMMIAIPVTVMIKEFLHYILIELLVSVDKR